MEASTQTYKYLAEASIQVSLQMVLDNAEDVTIFELLSGDNKPARVLHGAPNQYSSGRGTAKGGRATQTITTRKIDARQQTPLSWLHIDTWNQLWGKQREIVEKEREIVDVPEEETPPIPTPRWKLVPLEVDDEPQQITRKRRLEQLKRWQTEKRRNCAAESNSFGFLLDDLERRIGDDDEAENECDESVRDFLSDLQKYYN